MTSRLCGLTVTRPIGLRSLSSSDWISAIWSNSPWRPVFVVAEKEPVLLLEPPVPPFDWLPVDVSMPFDIVDSIETFPGIAAIWYMRVTKREMLIVVPSNDQSSPRSSVTPFRYAPTAQLHACA